jgi:hypothetical protein
MKKNLQRTLLLGAAALCAVAMTHVSLRVGGSGLTIDPSQAIALDAGCDGEGGGGGDPSGGDRGQGEGQSSGGGGSSAGADAGSDGGGAAGGPGGGQGGDGERGGKGAAGAVGRLSGDDAEDTLADDRSMDDGATTGFANITDPRSRSAIDLRGPNGIGPEAAGSRQPPQAVLRLREAAERGDAEAQFGLAVAYEKGLGVRRDTAWAARWYGRAAFRGHSEAQYKYGSLKLADAQRTHRNPGGAYRWLAVAARQGHMRASDVLSELETGLTIDQIYQAKSWAEAFEPTTGMAPWDPPTVEYLQKKLTDLGYDPGPVDGRMGPRTAAALERYKKAQGLPVAPGDSEQLLRAIRTQGSADLSLEGDAVD